MVIAGIWFSYNLYAERKTSEQLQQEERYAHVTAILWAGSVKFRHDIPAFELYRDSLLSEFGLNNDSLTNFIESFENNPQDMSYLMERVKQTFDSIVAVEDSLRQIDTTDKISISE